MPPKAQIGDYIGLGFRSFKGFGSLNSKCSLLDKTSELTLSEDR